MNQAPQQLKAFIERIERMDDEITALKDDRKEIIAEAKGEGFDTKIMLKIIAERKRDAREVAEEEALMETYKAGLEMA
jgi:uncharacterized protein (UPF0335 family)